MDDYFLGIRKRILALDTSGLESQIKRISRTQKKNILLVCILLLCMRLFFSVDFNGAQADTQEINLTEIDNISMENLDPISKIQNENRRDSAYVENSGKVCSNKKEKHGTDFDMRKAEALVSGHPIEVMLPYIEKRDKKTAYFLIAIAKKESDWGLHAPSKNGQDCYNYWGYKGNYNPNRGGYSCFDSPEQAIQVVGDRIQKLVDKRIDTPSKMVVWKCGSSCAGHSPADVKKWISDVDLYFRKMDA